VAVLRDLMIANNCKCQNKKVFIHFLMRNL
jgi:hypothetical protein